MSDCGTIDLSPQLQDIVAFKKGSIPFLLELLKEVDGVFVPLNLAGYTDLAFVVYNPADQEQIYVTWNVDNGQVTIVEAEGKVFLNVPESEVAGYPWSKASYYFTATDPSGVTAALTAGSVVLTLTPTQSDGGC